MKILGIELKASNAVLAVVDVDDSSISHIDINPKKISLKSDETADVKSFAQTFNAFLKDNGIDRAYIKTRNKKGEYSGGAVSFKIEGIIQATAAIEIHLINPQSIATHKKKNSFDYPKTLNKYQHTAYEIAHAGSMKQ